MLKLIASYRTYPTIKLAVRIRAYERAHPMAICLLPLADANLVADAIHRANREG